jgi:tetratricopeptide (TPR) repeat protein
MFEESCADFSAMINGGNCTLEDYGYRAYCELCLGMIDEFIVDILHDRNSINIMKTTLPSLLNETKNFEKVIEGLSRVIEADPDYHQAIFFRLQCYWCLEDWEKAIEDCSRLAELTDDERYYALRSYLCMEAGSYQKS